MQLTNSQNRGQSIVSPTRDIRAQLKIPFSVDEILRVQSKVLDRFRKNEAQYVGALNKINSQIEHLKNQTAFVKVENGRTIAEYLSYKNHNDVEDRRKRLDCLRLLDKYAKNLRPSNSHRVLPTVSHYYLPKYQRGNLKPTRRVGFLNTLCKT